MGDTGGDVTMDDDTDPQVDVPLQANPPGQQPPAGPGSQTPHQQASDLRNRTEPSQGVALPNGPSRSPQTTPTSGTPAVSTVTNAQLGER